jgi:TolB-like protein
MPADHSPYLVLAGEYAIPFEGASGMLLRAGLNFKNNADLGIMGVLSAGFGIRIKDTGFDYAFVPYGDLGVTHRFTISRGFGAASVPGGPSPDAGDFTAKRRGARAEKLSMAVAAFEPGDGVNKNLARLVSDLVEAELLKTPGFKLIERTNTKYIVSEKKLASAGLGNKERSLELARLTGARGVLYGDVLKTEKGYLIAVKLAAAATGEVLASESRPAEDDYLLPQTARELAAALAAD